MKNIILELITIFFVALIGWHIYNAYFGKTLEGLERRKWVEAEGLSDDALGTTGDYAPASAAGQRHQMQVEVKQQDIFLKNNEVIENLTAFKTGLEKRINKLEGIAGDLINQTNSTHNVLTEMRADL